MKPVQWLLAVALCLSPNLVSAQGSQPFPTPRQVEGLPIEERPPEFADNKPSFPNQTRAPFRKSRDVQVTVVTDQLDLPWSLQFLPDGRMLVTEKQGAIRIVDQTGKVSAPLKGLPEVSYAGDAGLHDLALDPDFARNGRIYFNYIRPEPGDRSRMALARAHLDLANGALTNLKVIYLASEIRPKLPSNQQPGRIAFGPDGSLYLALGDRSRGGIPGETTAQRMDTNLGKVVRLTTDGAPAKGNPFAGKPGVAADIWSYGHRTPEGLAFDTDGRLWATEHGARGGDELNLIVKGGNYGWPLASHGINYSGDKIADGRTELPGGKAPVYYWDPVIAPSGLAVYRGRMFPEWNGSILSGGLRGRMLDRLVVRGGRVVGEEPLLVGLKTRIRDVKVGPEGAVYVLTDEAKVGKLLKLTPLKRGDAPIVNLAGAPVTLAIPEMALIQDLPVGAGRQEFVRTCNACHGVAVSIGPRTDLAGWTAIVQAMRMRGAQADDTTAKRIAEYLAAHFGPGAPAPK